MFLRLSCVLLLFLTGCWSNKCQDLCETYYQMQLRCDLFGPESGQQPDTCESAATDPQTLQQQSDYFIRQCRLDFRNPSCDQERSCCKVDCFRELLTTYEAVDASSEADFDQQRDLCQKFRQLVTTGKAPWCTKLQVSCEQDLSCAN